MKNIYQISQLDSIPSFCPPHHAKTRDKKLVTKDSGAHSLEIWYGEIEPGGTAEMHVHTEMEQCFYILNGEAVFTLGEKEYTLEKGHLVFVPKGLPHKVAPTGQSSLKLLIIMAPPPCSVEAWKSIDQ